RYPGRARHSTLAGLPRCGHRRPECNLQTIHRAPPRATRSSLEVARGDGARPCPPKAPPSPPPRDLVQRTNWDENKAASGEPRRVIRIEPASSILVSIIDFTFQ